jgi:hypothetical protein
MIFRGATQNKPKNSNQAWNQNHPDDQEKYKISLKGEIYGLDSKKTCQIIKKLFPQYEEVL